MPAIKYKEKTYAGASFPCLEVTKAEYDALSEEKKMDGTVYMITDGDGGWEAEKSTYDNTASGLTATNVQDALDEINSNILGDLATVETTNGASKAYAVGDLLVLDNQLYKVTAAITSGADLVEGTNIQETTLADVVWKKGSTLTNFASGRTIRTGYDLTNNRLLIDIIFADGDIHRLGITPSSIKYDYYRGSTGVWTTNGTWNKSS